MTKTNHSLLGAATSPTPRDIEIVGALSIGIGGIVGGGIFATLGLAGSQARGATFLSFAVGGLVALLTSYMVLYVLITVVAIGHLSFEALAETQNRSVAAAAQTFLGGFGVALMSMGAILATASAINADFFGAAKLPVILGEEKEMPKRYAREIWGRHPAALILIATLAALIDWCVDLHAISAAASAGFLVVFAMVNVGNAKLARQTGSRRWVSVLAAVTCFGALAVMVLQLLGQPHHLHAVWLIVALIVFPFVYEFLYSAILARDKREL
jgi:amino acid transporter